MPMTVHTHNQHNAFVRINTDYIFPTMTTANAYLLSAKDHACRVCTWAMSFSLALENCLAKLSLRNKILLAHTRCALGMTTGGLILSSTGRH